MMGKGVLFEVNSKTTKWSELALSDEDAARMEYFQQQRGVSKRQLTLMAARIAMRVWAQQDETERALGKELATS